MDYHVFPDGFPGFEFAVAHCALVIVDVRVDAFTMFFQNRLLLVLLSSLRTHAVYLICNTLTLRTRICINFVQQIITMFLSDVKLEIVHLVELFFTFVAMMRQISLVSMTKMFLQRVGMNRFERTKLA